MNHADYKEALTDAPEWILEAWEAYSQLPKEVQDSRPFLYFILGKGTPDFKMPTTTARYVQNSATGQNCQNCRYAYFQPKREIGICSQIRGHIVPAAWCKLWKA